MSRGKNLFVWVTAKSGALLIKDGQLEKLWGLGDVQKKCLCNEKSYKKNSWTQSSPKKIHAREMLACG